jgi:hypothetical protein
MVKEYVSYCHDLGVIIDYGLVNGFIDHSELQHYS